MKRTLRRRVALSLVGLGALALVLSGAGALPGAPAWVWLVLVALGVVAQVAGDHYDQRLRLARRVERRLREVEGAVQMAHRQISDSTEALRQHIDAVGTPEGMKAFRDLVQRMANDLAQAKGVTDSINNAGGLKALLKR
jgi:hypothetical protein